MEHERDIFINLIQKFIDKSISEDERRVLQELMQSDEKKQHFFDQVTKVRKVNVDIDQAFAERNLNTKLEQRPVVKKIRTVAWYWAAAVLLVGMVSAVFLYTHFIGRNGKGNVYEAPAGQRTTFQLEDGTKVWLNGGSRIIVDKAFNKEYRKLRLDGEGYFQVSKNRNKPFIVETSDLNVQVLGTSFNVRSYPKERLSQVFLVEGKVELSFPENTAQTITLKPGDKISLDKGNTLTHGANTISQQVAERKITKQSIKDNAIEANIISWKENELVFDSDPMELVVSKLENWYGVKIKINDSRLNGQHVTGKFTEKDILEVFEILKTTGNINGATQKAGIFYLN